MTSFVDLEHERTDYFDGGLGDVVEPSSSPSEGSPSPLRALSEDAAAGLAGIPVSTSSSHAAGHDPVFTEHEDFHHFRKGRWSHARDSASSSKKLNSLLVLTSERLDKEIRRANDAERRTSEAIALARSANEAKLIAERDATRVNEELRMYKLQYDNAQREIFKAQELIDQIEAERQDAEAAAARARSTARKLKEQNLIIMAREEGRQLGYQEGLATGRRMAYDERMRAGDYTDDTEDEIILQEHPSNIRLRSPTPGAGSRPSSRPPAARQPPPAPPPPMRPPSRSTHANSETVPHPSTLATPIRPPPATNAGPPPSLIHLEATPPPRNRARSKSDPLGYPPDNWIPVADEKSYIAMPPPHHMSPSPRPVVMEPPPRMPSPAPVPPPPIVAEEATAETSTTSETSSETTPPQPSVRPRDYGYHASKIRERNERQPQRSRTPTILSPGSTRMSDYGLLSSPQTDQRKMKAPVQAQHFEIERGNTPTREKMSRSWSFRKKESVSSSPVRTNASPAPIPPPVSENVIAAPRPRKPGKSPLSRMSPSSSSSSSSTSTAKASTSSTSSTDRTKLDPRRDPGPGGDSRTPLGWLFKKRMKEHSGEKGSTSGNSVDITVESPSESNRSLDQSAPPENLPQPTLLSPDYRFSILPPEPPATTKKQDRGREPFTPTPKLTGENQNLPPLAEFTNLISPGQGNAAVTDLPPGFVPNSPLNDQMQQGGGGGGQPPRRSASTRSKRKDKEPAYNAAPLTPGLHYPTPPGADIPRSKSRASRSSRQGQLPGALSTP